LPNGEIVSWEERDDNVSWVTIEPPQERIRDVIKASLEAKGYAVFEDIDYSWDFYSYSERTRVEVIVDDGDAVRIPLPEIYRSAPWYSHTERSSRKVTLVGIKEGKVRLLSYSYRDTARSAVRSGSEELYVVKDGKATLVKRGSHPEMQAFARQQFNKLLEMGFSRRAAHRIFRAAGPGYCVRAAEWAIEAAESVRSWGEEVSESDIRDTLDTILSGIGGTNGFGWARAAKVLTLLGLEPPWASSATAFFRILRGAHAAILAGLPAAVKHE
jgi:hypothetical protein